MIADRRDLLGGRLIPILNGLRLARHWGAKFLMTWYTDGSQFQSYVAGLPQIFCGEIVEDFSAATGRGTIVAADHPLAEAGNTVDVVAGADRGDWEIGDLLVRPAIRGDAYRVDRRFSIYLLQDEAADAPTLTRVRKELGSIFREIAKPAPVSSGMSRVDEFISRHSNIACVHARRMHLLADTELQINRFDSFLDTSYYLSAVDHLSGQYGALTAASNSRLFTNEIRRIVGQRFVSLDGIIDRRDFTGLQWALLEMYFIGACRAIYGTRSAFTAAASILGGATLHSMFNFAVRERLSGNDKTGRIGFEQAKATGNVIGFAERIARTSRQAALCCRLSPMPDLPKGVALELACRGLALRLVQYPHPCFLCDWQYFTGAVRMLRTSDGDAGVAALVDEIEVAIAKRRRPAIAATAGREGSGRFLMIAAAVVAADLEAEAGQPEEALRCYGRSIRLAEGAFVECPGLYLRAAAVCKRSADASAQLANLRAAVQADGGCASAWAALACGLSERGQSANAMVALKRAVAAEPESGPNWARFAEALERHGLAMEAAAAMVRASDCDPENTTFGA